MKTSAPLIHLHFWLALALGFPSTIAGAPVPLNITRPFQTVMQPGPFKITPSSGRAGQVHEVLVVSGNPNCDDAPGELTEAALTAPEGSQIAVIESKATACRIAAKVRIPAETPLGKIALWIGKEKEEGEEKEVPLGFVEFSITAFVQPGQIPPGMTPAVDVMWSVMPRQTVSHNFGNALSKHYYAIEIIIGNNSAYNLQLVSVGFKLPSDARLEGLLARNAFNRGVQGGDDWQNRKNELLAAKTPVVKDKVLSNPVKEDDDEKMTLLPTSSYKLTRGSLEAKQVTHLRTMVLSTITALGPIFTGFTPYFHNVNHRGNWTEFINLFSNPLEKGLEAVWPDQKPRQRERFDDQVLRDGLIIRNNTQIRTLAFFPKELLRLPKHVESDAQYNAWKDNAREVRERLGKIVIIGDQIQYINRVSLTANTPPVVAPPPTINAIEPNSLVVGGDAPLLLPITIRGSNLQGATLSVSGTTKIKISEEQVDPNGHVITALLTVAEDTPPAVYQINVSTPSSMGAASVPFQILALPIEIHEMAYTEPEVSDTDTPVEITITGVNLHHVKIQVASKHGQALSIEGTPTVSDDKTSMTATVVVKGKTPAGDYTLNLIDTTTNNVRGFKIFKIKKKAAPTG